LWWDQIIFSRKEMKRKEKDFDLKIPNKL
jgi:hypothetical protein